MAQYTDVRPSPIAGQWYPGNTKRLIKLVDNYLDSAPKINLPGHVQGLVAPHAGYRYSGPIAAQAFKQVKDMTFERVVILSPMHHPLGDALLTTGHEAYQTPLGIVPVDHSLLEDLKEYIKFAAVRRDPEHSLEIQLPFLQRALADPFKLIPLMLREQTIDMVDRLAQALTEVLGDGRPSLIVASSDLSHFYTDARARELDQIMLDQIEAMDAHGVIKAEQEGRAFACGRGAIGTMLAATKAMGADRATIVSYATSGDTSGDHSRVVGYGAAVIYRST